MRWPRDRASKLRLRAITDDLLRIHRWRRPTHAQRRSRRRDASGARDTVFADAGVTTFRHLLTPASTFLSANFAS